MFRPAIALATTVLSAAALAAAIETVYVPAESKGWKLGHGSNRAGRTIAEFIPTSESIRSWSRMFTIQFLEGERSPPAAVMKVLQSQMLGRCPNTKWVIVSEDAVSVTYEWSIADCSGQADQHEVARLLKGNDGVHRIAYVRKVSQLEADERERWLKWFADAYVEKAGKRVSVAP
jgi:hypothetical protein